MSLLADVSRVQVLDSIDEQGFADACRAGVPLVVQSPPPQLRATGHEVVSALTTSLATHPVVLTENPAGRLVSQGADVACRLRPHETTVADALRRLADDAAHARCQVRIRFDDGGAARAIVGAVGAAVLGRRIGWAHSATWCANGGVRTPAHVDPWDGLLLQIRGTKRILLQAPAPVDRLRLLTARARVDVDDVEAHVVAAAAAAGMTTSVATTTPGSFLYLPAGWAHDVESFGTNVALCLRFDDPEVAAWGPEVAGVVAALGGAAHERGTGDHPRRTS